MPRSREVLIRSVSNISRKSKVNIPNCSDSEDLTNQNPVKTINTLETQASNLDTQIENEKVSQKKTEDTFNLSFSSGNGLSFDKQSPRKPTPTPQNDSRFETINHFPRISSKYKSTPAVDFNKVTPRKEQLRSFSPSFYSFSDKPIKRKLKIGYVDMSKGYDRFPDEKYKADTVNRDKVIKAYKMILPNSHSPTPDFNKVSARIKEKSGREVKKTVYDYL